jgi:hypothetical protein
LFLVLLLQFALPSAAALPEATGLAPRMPPLPGGVPELNHPVILTRPLFAPDRKPVAVPGAGGGIDGYQVIGIAISAERATVIMRAPNGKMQRVLYGGQLMGWRLVSVDRRQIVFDKAGEQRTLTLGARIAAAQPGVRTAQIARTPTVTTTSDEDEEDDELPSQIPE